MIQVLQTQQEVEMATWNLRQRGLPTHLTVQKNWDQWLLAQWLSTSDRQSFMVDLGCGEGCTLDLLAALGFQHLHGIDLTIQPALRDRPYLLQQGDLTTTPFPDQHFDYAVSISVIEHGVPLHDFFRETYRILKPNGLLFMTADYWQDKIQVEPTLQPFGLSWNIFSFAEVQRLIMIAQQQGFVLEAEGEVPLCRDRTVNWHQKHYTFIAIALRKPA